MKTTTKKIVITEEDLLGAKKTLAKLKLQQEKLREQELEIRTYLADALHDGEEGSRTIKIGDVKVTISRPLNYSIDGPNAEKLAKDHGPESLEILKWKPTISVTGFKKYLDIASEYCVVRPGPATVEFR